MKNKFKDNKGVMAVYVTVTVLSFLVLASGILTGATTVRKNQLRTIIEIKKVYEQDVDNKQAIYEQLATERKFTGGIFDAIKGVNTPKISEEMVPVVWNDTDKSWYVCNSTDTTWYNYNTSNKQWANIMLRDGLTIEGISEISSATLETLVGKKVLTPGSMFVWIPRFGYQISSNLYSNTAGAVNIVFLQGTTNLNASGGTVNTTYPTVSNNGMGDYVVHPAFTSNIENGGWNKDISGFWVSKFPAGFQQNTITDNNGTLADTISNSGNTMYYSGKNYTSYNSNFATNALNQDLTMLPTMSYPVFKPLTYAYNNISIGDSYTLSKEIGNATSFYGISDVDSHLMKNSQWGAVAYLIRSNYGIQTEPIINEYYISEASPYKVALTGVYDTVGIDGTQTLSNPYYSATGQGGSGTGNIYGVYDLNGCIWEAVAAYTDNPAGTDVRASFGASIVSAEAKHKTIYPYNTSGDSDVNNWTTYSSSGITRFGDAILETSTAGNGQACWNGDSSHYPNTTYPFITRGGAYNSETAAGIFAYDDNSGEPSYDLRI